MNLKQIIGKVAKTFGLGQLAASWLAGEDDLDRSKDTPTKPYKQVDLVYACVNTLISGVAGLPAVLSTIDDRVVEGGPQYDVLFNNPSMSFVDFVTQTIGHYALSRDVFWIFTENDGPRPKEIMVVSGTQMHPITHNNRRNGDLIGWEFRGINGERAQFSVDEVHQWKNFNPYDRFHGLGPVTAAKLSIDYTYAASLFNTSAILNGAEPGIILEAPGNLDPDQAEMILSKFNSRHKGAGKAGRTAIVTGGMKVSTVAKTMVDMQVAEITKMSDAKICAAFEVPPPVVGLVTEAQYSHGPAQRDLIFNTIIPLARLFAGHITDGILARGYSDEITATDFENSRTRHITRIVPARNPYYRKDLYRAIAARQKLFLWFDPTSHPTYQEAMKESADKVLKFVKAGVRLNDIIDAHDLPYGKTPWGEEWFIPMGLVPARYTLEAGLEGLTGPSAPEGGEEPDPKKAIEDLRKDVLSLIGTEKDKVDTRTRLLRLWRNWVVTWAGIERQYKEALRQYFLRQQRVLTEKLKSAFNEAGDKSVAKDRASDIIARVVFDLKVEDGKLKVINHTFFGKGSELGIRQALSETSGLADEAFESAVEDIKTRPSVRGKLSISSHNISDVNRVTADRITSQLAEGLDNGEDLNQLTGRIKETLGSNRARALRIARTQTAGAVNTGRQAGMKGAGVKLKSWITSGDDNVRAPHVAAGFEYAEGIPVDVAFNVDGELLMYPADPSGSAANIINCRCLQIARAAKGKTFDLDYYLNLNFYDYSQMQKDQKNET